MKIDGRINIDILRLLHIKGDWVNKNRLRETIKLLAFFRFKKSELDRSEEEFIKKELNPDDPFGNNDILFYPFVYPPERVPRVDHDLSLLEEMNLISSAPDSGVRKYMLTSEGIKILERSQKGRSLRERQWGRTLT